MTADVFEARMRSTARNTVDQLQDRLVELEPRARHDRVGRVVAAGDGVARVEGLNHPFAGELLRLGGIEGVAEDLTEDDVRVVLLGPSQAVRAGDTVRRTGRVLDVPVGSQILGRVVDPLGRPLDTEGALHCRRRGRVHPQSVELSEREPVQRPLRTGVFSVDTMIPIGRGQRQLIVGDRSTGKTELGLDILAAMDPEILGVYVAIGRRGSETAANLAWLRKRGFFERGFAVVSDADDPPGLVHLTPYAATTMAEELAGRGRDVVIVYDDLTIHADVHRSLALVLGRPVGREAHPVDVFYAHARLLERASQFGAARDSGSITAFPIVETQAADLSAYVPTNIVSITDGQIRLDADLLAAGLIPAVDVSLSVSRVGGKAQPPLCRKLAGSFKNRYAQFLELESFARFGTRLEPSAQSVVDWGRRVRTVLGQPRGASRSWPETIARLLLTDLPQLSSEPLDGLSDRVQRWCARMIEDPRFAAIAAEAKASDPETLSELKALAARVHGAESES